MKIVKDLVPDLSKAYEQLASIKPWLQKDDQDKFSTADNLEEKKTITK